ncbi:MAG TPA: hypothetical protein VFQ61_09360 [Polyangiaceae bacterium]|nr:hypothetical protein [Polyangiaceae bacterium]
MMEPETRSAFLMRVVQETLDSIVSPNVRDALLQEALLLGGEAELPTQKQRFPAFLDGPLRKALTRALGPELGQSVVSELERLTFIDSEPIRESTPKPTARGRRHPLATLPAGAAASEPIASPPRDDLARAATAPTWPVRAPVAEALPPEPRIPEPRIPDARVPMSADYPAGTAGVLGFASEPQVTSRRLPMVFLVTRSAELVQRFGDWLDPRVIVLRVSRLIDLMINIQDAGPRRMVVVLDAADPPMRLEAMAAVHEELPGNIKVVLWGLRSDLPDVVSELFPRSREWLVCSEPVPLSEAVARCVSG